MKRIRPAAAFAGFLLLLLCLHQQIPVILSVVDNGVLGDPYVDCGGNQIEVRFDTRNSFKGIVFVEGRFEDPQCRSSPVDDSGNGARNAQIRLHFRSCGINYTRHSEPRGVFLSARLVVAFNPLFLSKIDRVYDVRCFYMEMEHQLERELTVKMGPPVMHTKQVPMPVCRYEVLSGGPQGPPVFYATIGQMVYHKWTCESSEENQFCMVVHSCIVDDGHGDRVELLDEQGCAKDKYLLQNLDYVTDLMVGKEAHVYKYADRESIFFDCKITLSIKEPGSQFCPVPQCPDPPRRRHRMLKRRHLAEESEANRTEEEPNKHFMLASDGQNQLGKGKEDHEQEEDCVSDLGLFSLLPLNFVLLAGAIALVRDGFKQFQ